MTATMRALVKPAAAPGLELREVAVPRAGANEVLVKLEKTRHLRHPICISTSGTSGLSARSSHRCFFFFF